MTTPIKAVLFDMDGVLIDAKEWHFEALNQALTVFGMEISRYDHLVTFDGLPTRKKLQMLTLERGLPTGLHGLINDMKQQYTMKMVHAHCAPRFVHQFALSRLRRMGMKIALCSNSVRDTVGAMMQKADLLRYLDFFLSNQDVQHGKPDPAIYQLAVERLGLRADECLVVEDNANGVLAAQRAGVHVMQVATVDDVNLANILAHVKAAENQEAVSA